MIDNKKPVRSLEQKTTNTGFDKPSLYGGSGLITYGSDSNANFVDVVSVGPIESIDEMYINDVNLDTGEFPNTEIFVHTGDSATTAFDGNFPYVERTYTLGKQAEIVEGDKGKVSTTTFTRSVSGVGVSGVRINFNTSQFVHRDKENRRKTAEADFTVYLLDEEGNRIKSSKVANSKYYASNPTSVGCTILAREEDVKRVWEYEVEMKIRVNFYGTTVSGTWSASTITELYKETQSYENVAMVSGNVVARDLSGSSPKREYLVKGYKVDVPVYIGENNLFLGEFTKAVSYSHAWNAMAVLVDEKWGAGLPIDKINVTSFVEFDKYISEIMADGSKRYSHSQELLKSDSYFRIASQIVGAADGKLYEDTSGRVAVSIDRQTDKRRVITSYDILNEKVKKTTVPEKKKTNYVEAEFSDKTNNYQTTIVSVQDDGAIVKNGLVQEKLQLITCSDPLEADRTIKKVLVNSQIAVASYAFSVGHTHEDIQIGEVVELYDRIYSRSNYCGKTREGSTNTRIEIDPRTPINIEGITNPKIVFDNNREEPIEVDISEWTDSYIILSTPLEEAPLSFTSFGVKSGDTLGLKPVLIKVLGITNNQGVIQAEGVDYNDSIFSHIEEGTDLLVPVTRILPDLQEDIQGLSLTKITAGISANWDDAEEGTYVYFWKKFTGDTERDPNNTGILVTSGQTSLSNNTLPLPLEPARYEFSVYILNELTGESSSTKSVSINLDITDSATSSIPQPTNFDTENGQGTYEGSGFTLKWDQQVGTESPYLMGYILRITQGGDTLEYRLTSDYRSYQVTSQALTEAFGENYSRSFTARLIAYDDTLASAPTVTRIVNNAAPLSPEITVRVTGDILLSSNSGIPEDAIGSIVYVWESSDINSVRPSTALVFRSNQVAEIDLPNDTLIYDNRDYVFEAAWIDGFGETETNYGRAQIAFGPDVLIPEPMTLVRANAYSITGIQVEFEHDGVWLEKMKVYYRKTSESGEFLLDDSYLFEGDVRVSYDEGTQSGTFIIEGLDYNSEYEIYTTVSNISSADSEASGTVVGITIPYANVEDIRNDILEVRDDILDVRDQVDGELKPQLNLETLRREESDRELFNTTASLAEFRRNSNSEFNTLRDATFEVNPETGTIELRAYNYADTQFTQAGILIDGVDAKVSINAGKIIDLGTSVQDANASIDVLAGQVEIKASYTEMTEYVNGALDAIIPAYSFGFFNSSEGWSAVNGTITQGNSFISTTWGDIENQMLNYSADDNPIITLTTKRLSGSGFTGNLVVTFDGGATETYTAALSQGTVGVTNVQNLNLTEDATYTGTVTGLRIILGESSSDEFEVSSITIGKPSAQLEALDGVTAQVNQLGIDVDAIEGQLTSFVTTAFYDENSVTLNNVTQVLDGEEAIISLRATQQELDNEGTITKANSASLWVDGANATIRSNVVSFNAEEGGIDDQIEGLIGGLNTVQQELSTIDGAKVRSNLVSINRLDTKSKDLEELQFYTELKILDQKNRDLELGDSVAIVDTQLKALSTDQGALSQEILELTAASGTIEGQVTANSTRIQQAETDIEGNASALAALSTKVENVDGDLSQAELLLYSETNGLGVVSSRAYLGVSETVDGKTTVTGITADSSTNGLRFQGDVVQFDDSSGNPALQYRADLNKWVFTGNVVVGGYTVESEDDIRALDGDTIYEVYQYSVDGSTAWHDDYTTGDLFRRTATVTNGVLGAWRDVSRITGRTPAISTNPDGSVTISNGTEEATIYDGENAPIPTITDNGDGTYTINNGAGDVVTISDGETPVKGVDYFDGLDGSFVSNIFITSSTGAPATPTGGTFDGTTETFPTGWQDTPYFVEGDITYISTTRYSQQSNGSWIKSGWSNPAEYIIKGEDGADGKDALANLINPADEWVVGTSGSQGEFIQYGSEFNNKVVNIEGPEGVVEPVWVSEGTQSAAAGGWSKTISGDPTKSYRFSVWAYRRSESDSRLYFGCQGALNLDLSANNNPYFNSDVGLPEGYKWYLLVGIVHGNNGSAAPNTDTSGVYDPESGARIQGFSEFVNDTSTPTLLHRVYRREAANYYDTRFARPRIDLIDGNEPSIAELIGRTPLDGQSGAGFYGSTYSSISWTTSTANSRFSALVGRSPVNLDIFTQTRIDGTDSQARQYNGNSWVSVALQVNGSIVASGTIAGDRLIAGTEINAPRIVGGDVIGSKVATAEGTTSRTEIEDDGTYMIWTGSGTKTDSNATFFVKKDGTGFVSGSFFAGQIIETKFNQGTDSVSVIHNSAGNQVEITISSNGSGTVIANNSPSPVGASTYTLPYTVKRGSTTLEAGNVIVTRVVEYDAPEGEYTTRDYYNFSTTVVDNGTASAAYTYSVVIGTIPLSTATEKTSIRSYEDLLTS